MLKFSYITYYAAYGLKFMGLAASVPPGNNPKIKAL
jgi:hypothetical protein